MMMMMMMMTQATPSVEPSFTPLITSSPTHSPSSPHLTSPPTHSLTPPHLTSPPLSSPVLPLSKVKRLFRYYSEELVQGRAVTSMVWNTLNSDLLAVGYGKIDTFVDTNKLGDLILQSYLLFFFHSLEVPLQ